MLYCVSFNCLYRFLACLCNKFTLFTCSYICSKNLLQDLYNFLFNYVSRIFRNSTTVIFLIKAVIQKCSIHIVLFFSFFLFLLTINQKFPYGFWYRHRYGTRFDWFWNTPASRCDLLRKVNIKYFVSSLLQLPIEVVFATRHSSRTRHSYVANNFCTKKQ